LIEVRPETFTLVEYDAHEVRRLAAEAAARAGVTDVEVEIDEELPMPITACTSDVVDGRGRIWMSGGNLEDPKDPQHFQAELAASELTVAMLRVRDRLQDGFAGAPPDEELSDRDRAAWDTWAYGRCARLGVPVREQRSRYAMRLYHGFTDVTDAAFERLWAADDLAWESLVAIGEETASVDPRPRSERRAPVRKPDLRARIET
jgi:hypothetical protein